MAFLLTVLSDTIRLVPSTFQKQTMMALKDEINMKFANKVMINTGLCICLFDILYCGKALIKYGDGSAYVSVKFRLIVFRPFIGEVLTGKIQSVSHLGIKGFIFEKKKQNISTNITSIIGDMDEQQWIWHSSNGDLCLSTGDTIRFVIENELFVDCNPQSMLNKTCEQESAPYTLMKRHPATKTAWDPFFGGNKHINKRLC
ncbi:hypothetical protein PORY_000317 [Pneumocystis oryctolagi]|uniref:Uncharacterized protein n=1 Tax=Pneumocystis oryctolagi TaxID=42067 RepID=A0ACB7CGW4_9ASCO|nr:hypothetical protein PORY_000317 [Pneumocystis oryctolagi]